CAGAGAMPEAKRLLVVEDNAILRKGLAVVLREEGFTVVTAENCQEALNGLQTGSLPDLILLDMHTPVLDGWGFLKLLRTSPAASVPVLVTTGNAILSTEWAASQGCAGLLRKPVEPETLLPEIHRCLEGP